MPGFDGTWPSGQGPLAGQGRGFCILKNSEKRPHQLEGFAGLQGTPVGRQSKMFKGKTRKKMIDMLSAYGEGLVRNTIEDASSDQHLIVIRKET